MDTRRIPWRAVVLTLALVIAAPVPGTAQQKDEKPEPDPVASPPATTVTIANYNWLDMHVYVARAGGGRTTLGMVTSQATRSFELPEGFRDGVGDLHVVADPIGSGRPYVSPAFFPDPGTDFKVDLHATLGLSSASVRAGMMGR